MFEFESKRENKKKRGNTIQNKRKAERSPRAPLPQPFDPSGPLPLPLHALSPYDPWAPPVGAIQPAFTRSLPPLSLCHWVPTVGGTSFTHMPDPIWSRVPTHSPPSLAHPQSSCPSLALCVRQKRHHRHPSWCRACSTVAVESSPCPLPW
jgi:hypothetical protein